MWSKLFWIWQKITFLQYRAKEQIAELEKRCSKQHEQQHSTAKQETRKTSHFFLYFFFFKSRALEKKLKKTNVKLSKKTEACFFNLECEKNFVFFCWHVRTRPKSCIQKGNLPTKSKYPTLTDLLCICHINLKIFSWRQ